MSFFEKYSKQFSKKKNFLCVGLDPDLEKIPSRFLKEENPLWSFNEYIIQKTSDYAVAYKPNLAFYEAFGLKGWEALEKTCKTLRELSIPVILDAKRGDIGNTAKQYAKALFEDLKGDSVTLSPYMGFDSIEPFAAFKNKVSFILALTSNKSAKDFEFLELNNGKKLYEAVTDKVVEWRADSPNLGMVIGATQEEALVDFSKKVKNMPLLIPGVGSQGGSLEKVVKFLYKENALLINVSRGVLYAKDPEKAASSYQAQMQELLS